MVVCGRPLSARYFFQELGFAALGDRVVVGEGAKEGLFEGLEKFPSLALLFKPRRRG
jgi:hypothetical protein